MSSYIYELGLPLTDLELGPSFTSGYPPLSPGSKTSVFLSLLDRSWTCSFFYFRKSSFSTGIQNHCLHFTSSLSFVTNKYKQTYISPFISAFSFKVSFSFSTWRLISFKAASQSIKVQQNIPWRQRPVPPKFQLHMVQDGCHPTWFAAAKFEKRFGLASLHV